jgi:hypothetical protein
MRWVGGGALRHIWLCGAILVCLDGPGFCSNCTPDLHPALKLAWDTVHSAVTERDRVPVNDCAFSGISWIPRAASGSAAAGREYRAAVPRARGASLFGLGIYCTPQPGLAA